MSVIVRTDWDTSTNRDLLRGGLRKLFDNTSRQYEQLYSNMYKEINTDQMIERDARMAGFHIYDTVVAEGANIPLDDPKFDTTKDYTQVKYGKGFRITFEMKKFNKIGQMQKLTKSLARVMRLSKDIKLAALWNSTAATYLGFDGLGLGHNTHTCLDDASTTYDNLGAAAMSTTSLENAMLYFKTLVDDQGQKSLSVKPDTIYFEPTLMFTADILFGSSGMPFEESNSKNPYSKFGLKQFPYRHLSSTTAWGVLAKSDPDYDINVFTSMKPDFKVQDAPDTTSDTIVTSKEMYTFGFGVPNMVYIGST
jgi:hypothetical protein